MVKSVGILCLEACWMLLTRRQSCVPNIQDQEGVDWHCWLPWLCTVFVHVALLGLVVVHQEQQVEM